MSDQTILVTGAAGFIGFHVARQLLAQGRHVVGLDSLNSYYDPALKQSRLTILRENPRFDFLLVTREHPGHSEDHHNSEETRQPAH